MLDSATVRQSWRDWWSFSIRPAGPRWLQLLWTILFSTVVAIVVALLAWGVGSHASPLRFFGQSFVYAQAIGLTIYALFEVAGHLIGVERIEAFRGRTRLLFFFGIPIIGVLIGYMIALALLGVDVVRYVENEPHALIVVILFSLILSAFMYSEAERERERANAAELQRQAIGAQLAALQAQIEPHFLFNTLANVVSLIGTAPDKARLMLERLIELLRATLAGSRSERTTLGQEARLIAAYLEILQIRMGPRLSYVIDVPDDLANARIPPLSLQPLVENSIQHGLEPKSEGGTVRVSARNADGALQVDVEDDGLGFSDKPGAGVG
ncbi:MAG: sensor histidine kinase, partial [Burkholderiaceae bacterium]